MGNRGGPQLILRENPEQQFFKNNFERDESFEIVWRGRENIYSSEANLPLILSSIGRLGLPCIEVHLHLLFSLGP